MLWRATQYQKGEIIQGNEQEKNVNKFLPPQCVVRLDVMLIPQQREGHCYGVKYR